MAPDQIQLAVSHHDVSFCELNAAGADGFRLPALQRYPGLEAFFDKVIMKGFTVFGDAHGGRHGEILIHRFDALPAGVDGAVELDRFAVEEDGLPRDLVSSEQCSHQLRAPRAHQADQAKDLALP
jgi:hypothetical protein